MNNEKNIELIVDLLKSHGLDTIVISPGGTNQGFVKAVQDDPFFKCYSVVDERSAIYFAIGLYLQLNKPIVTSCTSAQATRNYIPGLTEAYYKHVPILAITMCKHPRFFFQGYMQAPHQNSLPDDSVKGSYVLPCISDDNDILHASRLINQSILELTRNSIGPVQLCVPWIDFPLKSSKIPNKIINHIDYENINDVALGKRILLCIGEHLPFSEEIKKEIELFCETNNVVVYTNHLSNYSGKYVINGNLPLIVIEPNVFIDKYKPDILITIGGQTGDYPFYELLSRNDIIGVEHWHISSDGSIVDTYDKLVYTIQLSEINFFKSINSRNNLNNYSHEYFDCWKELYTKQDLDLVVPFSAVSIAQALSEKIPNNSIIQFSILHSLRVWNMFSIDSSIECYSNVGAFGIDGGLSTLIGQSVCSDKLSFMIIGDLAFLYDINSISIRHIKNNLRILIINNSGGMEFKLWGGDSNSIDRYISAAGHYKSAEGWANTCGFKYLKAYSQEEFVDLIDVFTGDSNQPIILEAFVSDENERIAYSDLINSNRTISIKEKAKSLIKKIIK